MIATLEGEISNKDVQIQSLTEQLALQDSVSDSSYEDECYDTFTENSTCSTCTPVEASSQNGGAQVTSLDASQSLYSPRMRSCSDVTELRKV